MSVSCEPARVCPKCGRTIPAGQAECSCLARPRYWLHSRETILLLSFAALAAAFGVTGFAAKGYHAQRRSLAEEWHRRGVSDLAAGRAEAAVADFGNAMVYARENVTDDQLRQYQLDLAESLVATKRTDEARSYLLDLWEGAPGNSEINLDLARLYAREGDDSSARRCYQGAIDGVWQGSSDQVAKSRFDTRLEFYHYLAGRGDAVAAQSVLLATAASLPPDSARNTQVGQLMFDSGHPQQALPLFEQALRIDRRDIPALTGAGLASFTLGNDAVAVRYLEEASREEAREPRTPSDSQKTQAEKQQDVSRTLGIARETLAIDPYRAGIGMEDRAERAIRSYNAAVARLASCATQQGVALPKVAPKTASTAAGFEGLAGVYARLIETPPQESDLVKHPPRVEQVMGLVFEAEAAADQQCGPPQDPTDAALERLSRRTESGRP